MNDKRRSPGRRKRKGQGKKASEGKDQLEELAAGKTASKEKDWIEGLAWRMKSLEEAAFSEFAELFGPILRSHFIKHRRVPVFVAEEVASLCMTDIPLKTMRAYKEKGYFAWVFTVANNMLNDWLRKNKERLSTTVPLIAEEANYQDMIDEYWISVARFMERVDQECQIPDLSLEADTESGQMGVHAEGCATEAHHERTGPDKEVPNPSMPVVRAVRDALGRLNDREREIVECYDLYRTEESETLKEIGRSMNLSHGNARQIHRRALKRLGDILAKDPRITNHPRIGKLFGRNITCIEP